MSKKLLTIALFLFSLFLFNFNVLAAETGLTTNLEKEILNSNNNIFKPNVGDYINPAINLVIVIGALICFIVIVSGAITWISSSGDKGKIEQASKKITSAILGLAILASAWIIWRIVINFLGIENNDLLNITGASGGGNYNTSSSDTADNCPFDVTSYVTQTGSLSSGYGTCNGNAWCLTLNLPNEYSSCKYLKEAYTDNSSDSCASTLESLKLRKTIGNGGKICFNDFDWGGDRKAELIVRHSVSGSPGANLRTYKI